MENKDYCKCKEVNSVSSEIGEWGYWDVCNDCGKVIEDSFEYHDQSEDD